MTLCLNMIVKNEVANLERCLSSLVDHVTCWVIVDTGSTDGTQEMIRRFFAARGIPGEMHSAPFESFSPARNAALDLARSSSLDFDYLLLADADMELTVTDPDFARKLMANAYRVRQESAGSMSSGIAYWNTRLVRRGAQARYVGVTHEYIDLPAGETRRLEGIAYIDHACGANRPGKFSRDAALLRNALETETDPLLVARYTFYLAQSYRDAGEREEALRFYLRRAGQGCWDQEIYVSLLEAGRLMEALGRPADDVLDVYRKADHMCSGRAEAAHAASRLCRQEGRFVEGYALAKAAIGISMQPDGLFLEPWIYQYGALDEYAVNAYWAGHPRDCLDACLRALQSSAVPQDQLARFYAKMRFALDALG